jgi:hypothetical protein
VNSLWVPRVSVTLVSRKLARKIGALGLNFQPVIVHAGEFPTSSDDSSSVNGSEDTESESEWKANRLQVLLMVFLTKISFLYCILFSL